MIRQRRELPQAKRLVVKVGSSSITGDSADQLAGLVRALAEAHQRGQEIVLVSSGAIASGMPLLALGDRPLDLATQQAAAAVGQNVLMRRYQDLFDPFGITSGQVLLTVGDVEHEPHRSNARRTIERMVGLRVIPIVNENDTVATQEIRFGDNDRLAAQVAELVGADALVLLSDVDAIYTAPPATEGATPIDTVSADDDLSWVTLGSAVVNTVGTGGALTKVSAARLATAAGIPTLVTGTWLVGQALRGESPGTWFDAPVD